ncbi:MAG: hypothetical protein KVP17_002916 [Porospora cf. gigantea B]|nr:MAG: hypothetical protein KVP17_002916 [Porospora cf. gigantea B]
MMDDLFSVLTPSEPGLTVLTPPKAPLDYLLDDGRKRRRKPQEHDKYKRRRLGLKESMPDEIEEGEISDDSHSSNDRRRHPPPSWDVSLPTHPSPMPFVYPPTRPPFPIHPVINLPPVLPPPLLPSVSYSPFIVTPPPPPPDVVSESPLLRPDVTELSDISESSGDETDELPLLRPESDRREQGAMTETFCE